MSQDSPRAGPLSDDASQTEDRSVIEEHVSIGPRGPSRRPPLRARPQSWHPYGPVEPPLESSASRAIGVHAILNPTSQAAAEAGPSVGRESRGLPGPSSPRPRQGSSPVPRPIHPLAQQPLSPRSHSRPLMNPGSPSTRFVGGGGRASGQSSVAHSPLVPQEPPLGLRQPTSSSPLPLDSSLRPITSLPGAQPPLTSLHSTPSIHSRRTSSGPGPGPLTTPNSQEASPTTPHSGYSHFGHASPAVANVSLPPSTAPFPPTAATPTPYMTMESASRGTPAPAGPRSTTEDSSASMSTPGMIPCVLDLKSGSTSQAEKRKANSDASRRFRNRKRNEMQLEQRLSTQQDEIRRQSEEIRSLLQRVEYYRSERDFYRDHLGRSMSLSSLPPRPPSPRSTAVLSPAETNAASAWPAADGRAPSGPQSIAPAPPARLLDTARPQPNWHGKPAPYSPGPKSRGLAPSGPPPVAGGPLPPFQGSWARP